MQPFDTIEGFKDFLHSQRCAHLANDSTMKLHRQMIEAGIKATGSTVDGFDIDKILLSVLDKQHG